MCRARCVIGRFIVIDPAESHSALSHVTGLSGADTNLMGRPLKPHLSLVGPVFGATARLRPVELRPAATTMISVAQIVVRSRLSPLPGHSNSSFLALQLQNSRGLTFSLAFLRVCGAAAAAAANLLPPTSARLGSAPPRTRRQGAGAEIESGRNKCISRAPPPSLMSGIWMIQWPRRAFNERTPTPMSARPPPPPTGFNPIRCDLIASSASSSVVSAELESSGVKSLLM